VGYKDVNDNGPDGHDSYYQSASLADFSLALLRDGVPVAASDSSVDNLEHLSWKLTDAGNYTLEVYRFIDGGLKEEEFAVAARAFQAETMSSAKEPSLVRGLSYEADGMLRGFEVPEPGATGIVGFGVVLLTSRRARSRWNFRTR
jgi:hypothetical protein